MTTLDPSDAMTPADPADFDRMFFERLQKLGVPVDAFQGNVSGDQLLQELLWAGQVASQIPEGVSVEDLIERYEAPGQAPAQSQGDSTPDPYAPLTIDPNTALLCTRDPQTGIWKPNQSHYREIADRANQVERETSMRALQLSQDPVGYLKPFLEAQRKELEEKYESQIRPLRDYYEQAQMESAFAPFADRFTTTDEHGQRQMSPEAEKFQGLVGVFMKSGMTAHQAMAEAGKYVTGSQQAAPPPAAAAQAPVPVAKAGGASPAVAASDTVPFTPKPVPQPDKKQTFLEQHRFADHDSMQNSSSAGTLNGTLPQRDQSLEEMLQQTQAELSAAS